MASLDDLYQAGCLGIVKASENYDSKINAKFSSYAYNYILGEMKEVVRKNKPLSISKEADSLNIKINKAKTLLAQQLMRNPTMLELSEFLDIDYLYLNKFINNNSFSSIDEPLGEDSLVLGEMIASKSTDIDLLLTLKEEILNLKEPDRTIMIKRYYEDMTQTEIADELGLNQTSVSRCENKVLKKLRQTV